MNWTMSYQKYLARSSVRSPHSARPIRPRIMIVNNFGQRGQHQEGRIAGVEPLSYFAFGRRRQS
jgi:hypothetical protein